MHNTSYHTQPHSIVAKKGALTPYYMKKVESNVINIKTFTWIEVAFSVGGIGLLSSVSSPSLTSKYGSKMTVLLNLLHRKMNLFLLPCLTNMGYPIGIFIFSPSFLH